MEKNIVFIESKPSFIIRTISEKLKENGFECMHSTTDISTIGRYAETAEMFLVNLTDDIKESAELFTYLRDVCIEGEKPIFFCAYLDDMNMAKKYLPASTIMKVFERPLNAKAIVDEISMYTKLGELTANQKHILVVDDSGEMLRTVKTWLGAKYKVSLANSAASAISFLAVNKPDLILLDYEMPVCSGPVMLQMIRSEVKTGDIPVMFLTGKGDAESVKSVLALKPQGYILKSHTPSQIIETIDNFFEMRKTTLV
ncbi:MAG: response regulator [Lachnospiraceae bacterium]|nr:response regulator [Lachnospiraceae bacterium]